MSDLLFSFEEPNIEAALQKRMVTEWRSAPCLKQGHTASSECDTCLPEQVVVDYSVKVAVVHSVVHMAVLVVVLPPGLDGQEVPIGPQLPMVVLGSLIG